jgi:hypothetical protein
MLRTLCYKIIFHKKSNTTKKALPMSKDKVISLENPEGNADVLTGLLRLGGRELITKAVQSELAEFLSQYQDMTDNQGRTLVVCNGYLPQTELMTDIGPVDIKVPKIRDLGGQGIQVDSKNSEDAIGNFSKILNRINDISNTIASVVEEQTATTNENGQSITEAVKETPKISDNITGVETAAKSTTQEATETQKSAQNMA